MNKLLYNETIKHINRSIISVQDNYNYAPDDVSMRVHNPISNICIYFIKNTMPTLSYNVSFGSLSSNPFTAAESEQLFKYVEKRYNNHFKDVAEEKISLYKRMLISNNTTRSK